MVNEKCDLCKLTRQFCTCPDTGQISSGTDREGKKLKKAKFSSRQVIKLLITSKIIVINLVYQRPVNVASSCDNLASRGELNRPSITSKSSSENFKDSNCPKSETDDAAKFASLSSDFEMIDDNKRTYSSYSTITIEGSCAENKAPSGFSGSNYDEDVAQKLIQLKMFDVKNNVGFASQTNLLKIDPSNTFNL